MAALLLLLAFVLFRNFERDRAPRAQGSSDLIQKEQAAIAETKTAFSEFYAHRRFTASTNALDDVPAAPAAPGATAAGQPGAVAAAKSRTPPAGGTSAETHGEQPRNPTASQARRGRGVDGRPLRSRSLTDDTLVDDAIGDWRALAAAPSARAGAWRRLGITLFLFKRPGGMAAFRHIASLPRTSPDPVPALGMSRRLRERLAALAAASLPQPDESALWQALYGRTPLRSADVPGLRAKLARLRLGWFEDITAAQLYARAGMPLEADRAARQAHRSADSIITLLTVEGLLRLVGLLLLIAHLLGWFVRRIAFSEAKGRARAAAAMTAPASHPLAVPGAAPRAPVDFALEPSPASAAFPPPADLDLAPRFSYRARMIAFVVYFGSYLVIAWPLKFIVPLIANWSDRDALRLNVVVDLAAFVPVVAITLIAFKRLAEADLHRRLSWRETWSAAGMRTNGPARDILTAVVSYTMLVPLLLFASQLSSVLFRHFHTPVHPVDLIILNSQDGWTRGLLFVQAVVAAPIVEEMMFRGLLFEGLRDRWGLLTGAALSAAIFALSHNTLPGGFLQLWTLGFGFAIVSRRTRSIVPNILMHGIHNGLVMMIMFAVFSQ
jgi:membrane protease YdiL (CAAX protease family)